MVAADVLIGKAIEEAEVLVVVSWPLVQVVAKVLLAVIELLAVEIVGEMAGEVDAHGEAVSCVMVSLGVVRSVGIFLVATGDSSSGRLHYSPFAWLNSRPVAREAH